MLVMNTLFLTRACRVLAVASADGRLRQHRRWQKPSSVPLRSENTRSGLSISLVTTLFPMYPGRRNEVSRACGW
jgi:hypothetical protein